MPQNTHSHSQSQSRTHTHTREHTNNTLTRWNNESARVLCLLSVAYTVWLCLCTFIYMQTHIHIAHVRVRKVACVYGWIRTSVCTCYLIPMSACQSIFSSFILSFFPHFSFSPCELFFLSTLLLPLFFSSTRFIVHFLRKYFFLFFSFKWLNERVFFLIQNIDKMRFICASKLFRWIESDLRWEKYAFAFDLIY